MQVSTICCRQQTPGFSDCYNMYAHAVWFKVLLSLQVVKDRTQQHTSAALDLKRLSFLWLYQSRQTMPPGKNIQHSSGCGHVICHMLSTSYKIKHAEHVIAYRLWILTPYLNKDHHSRDWGIFHTWGASAHKVFLSYKLSNNNYKKCLSPKVSAEPFFCIPKDFILTCRNCSWDNRFCTLVLLLEFHTELCVDVKNKGELKQHKFPLW